MAVNNFKLSDLGMAYRKAKVDLFYSSDPRPQDLLEFEENLKKNLESLLGRLNSNDEAYFKSNEFLGSFTYIPKKIENPNSPEEDLQAASSENLIIASPSKQWAAKNNSGEKKAVADFRLMSKCSIEFHVVSALWIGKVGEKLDSHLGDAVRANRLRRTKEETYNWFSSGNFKPYLHEYRKWRDDGLEAMLRGLDGEGPVIAITADASNFYHKIDPSFLMKEEFFETVGGVELGEDEQSLHELFALALETWSVRTGNRIGRQKAGLPVGLPASGLVANLSLIGLDCVIEDKVAPLYYGRYVDDLILVIRGSKSLDSVRGIWKWLEKLTGGKLKLDEQDQPLTGKKPSVIRFNDAFIADSRVEFSNSKNKVFLLEGEPGRILLESIRETINQRSSEWRELPFLPQNPREVSTSIVGATQNNGDTADSLRTAENMSASRSAFALKLRDFEAYARDLDPKSWGDHRKAFHETVLEHVLVLPHYFALAQFVPRIFQLAVDLEDWEYSIKLIEKISKLNTQVEETCLLRDPASKAINRKVRPSNLLMLRWRKQLGDLLYSAIITANSDKPSAQIQDRVLDALEAMMGTAREEWPSEQLRWELTHRDLARTAFRELLLLETLRKSTSPDNPEDLPVPTAPSSLLVKPLVQAIEKLVSALPDSQTDGASLRIAHSSSPGLMFPTRPLNAPELFAATGFLSTPSSKRRISDFDDYLVATRGFVSTWEEQIGSKSVELNDSVLFPLPNKGLPGGDGNIRVAVASLETKDASWVASVHQKQDLTLGRYNRLVSLINDVLRISTNKPHYLVFPETSIPTVWFMRFANKLKSVGISLIAGVEYIHDDNGSVHNQTWASLVHDGFGFPTNAIYYQDKLVAAPLEEKQLWGQRRLQLKPERVPWLTPPVITHGEFKFALLVCSELTNIQYRAALVGKIDALIIPEWNQDLKTFGALVESAALDLHTYVVQVNNRKFGDSRIRAPYAKEWDRDVLRVSGGLHDHFVVGKIDVHGLREFQSQDSVPEGLYKPLPDGFKNSFDPTRRRVPGS